MVGKICGTGSFISKLVWDNDKLAQMVDTNDEWIRGRTGVARRHIADEGENTAQMASEAAKAAIMDAGIAAEDVELLIVATITSNRDYALYRL